MNDIKTQNASKLTSNILVLILLVGNIFFAYQYISVLNSNKNESVAGGQKTTQHEQITNFNKFFVQTVLNSKGGISSDDRIKLENDMIQIHDQDLLKSWNEFVNSKDDKTSQLNAMKLFQLLADKMV